MTIWHIIGVVILCGNIAICTYMRSMLENFDDRLDEFALVEYQLSQVLTDMWHIRDDVTKN